MITNNVSGSLALTNDQLLAKVPSVFAESAHESRTKRYSFIPSDKLLEALKGEGFYVASASQTHSRTAERRAYTKHLIRLRHAKHDRKVGEEFNEIVLLNSHDGTSPYRMMGGRFRLICMNGLVVGSVYDQVCVRHSGNPKDAVIEGAYKILNMFDRIDDSVAAMKGTRLSAPEQRAFGRAALALRYPAEDYSTPLVTAEQIIEPRRVDDNRSDLWTVFNRTQENLMRGGQRTTDIRRHTHSRSLRHIDRSVALNRDLWTLAEETMKAKVG